MFTTATAFSFQLASLPHSDDPGSEIRADGLRIANQAQSIKFLTAAADGELLLSQVNERVKPIETVRCHFLERHGLGTFPVPAVDHSPPLPLVNVLARPQLVNLVAGFWNFRIPGSPEVRPP